MSETVTIYLDDKPYQVPKGANLVDAAKAHGIEIPVFCYHPKLGEAGKCRVCLVEIGMPQRDRETGQIETDENGEPIIRWFPKLQTACTTHVSDGMRVRTTSKLVQEARREIVEFLLTNHPLDCPTCDKGGECALQDLTVRYGPGTSSFYLEDKLRLAKHKPLGDLIILDQERCIQCARCVRFCEEIVDDPVLAFAQRGRKQQIITASDPPFDSKFSGNVTDICPVGALTTADFRFGARPWELKSVPSICAYCPVGCNITLDVRAASYANGHPVVKRVMPRQNEAVNGMWICDKGRFGHHFTHADDRLSRPMIRKDGELVEADWDEALAGAAQRLKSAVKSAAALAGPALSNEDMWMLRNLMLGIGSERLGTWPTNMGGAEYVAKVGVATGSNFADMGAGDVILVVASDLEEEAPIWWLRVKRAADRGATLVVLNGRPTKLDRYTDHVIRYRYGDEVGALNALIATIIEKGLADEEFVKNRVSGYEALAESLRGGSAAPEDTARAIAEAANLVVIVGGEAMSLERHSALMAAAANLLIATGHVGRPNNGLLPVWPGANFQGALDIGFDPEITANVIANGADVLIIAGADPVAEDPEAAKVVESAGFVIVADMFRTATAEKADVVLPICSFAEYEGTFTSGDRRVQRFYQALDPFGEARPAWKAFDALARAASLDVMDGPTAMLIMEKIAENIPVYADITYPKLAEVADQWPPTGPDERYYVGTVRHNEGGTGIQWPATAEDENVTLQVAPVDAPELPDVPDGGLLAVPVRVLYDRSETFARSEIMAGHVPESYAVLNDGDAIRLGIAEGDTITLSLNGIELVAKARTASDIPEHTVLIPLRLADRPIPAHLSACAVGKVED